jgi:diguanylate cyclase (GGDEF)-like protein
MKVDKDATLEAKLNEFRQQYALHLPEKITRLRKLWDRHLAVNGDYEALRKFHQLSHQLAGSAGTYGFAAIGVAAQRLDTALAAGMALGEMPEASVNVDIVCALVDLEAIVKDALITNVMSEEDRREQSPASSSCLGPLVCVISDDQEQAHELAVQIGYYGYRAQACHVGRMDAWLKMHTPDVLIGFPAEDASEAAVEVLLRKVSGCLLPVIALLPDSNMTSQFAAVRAGVSGCMARPFEMARLIDRLDSITARKSRDPYRVLIIDDDLVQSRQLSAWLTQAGIKVSLLSQPLRALDAVADFSPDLILLDRALPDCNGFELAAVLRQQDSCLGVPIVFLSSQSDTESRLLALQLGGDDFLPKPVSESDLLVVVTGRIHRARLLVNRMVRDGLTGLFNHCHFKEQLEVELARAVRTRAHVAVGFIDISGLAAINGRHGYAAGDNVLKSLASLLRHRLRKTDIIGRYAGPLLAVILEGSSLENARKVFEEIIETFAKTRHRGASGDFQVSCSCGMTSAASARSPRQIIAACEAALKEAKALGQGQVKICG